MRKCYCRNPDCSQQIFTERLPAVVAPWARRTQRLAAQQRHIGLALGGAASERLSDALDCVTSRDTFIHYNPVVRALAQRLERQNKAAKVIIAAAMRKLIHLAYGVLKHKRPFDPN